MKLNLGSGSQLIEGFTNLDAHQGDVIFPLPHADGSVDEIRASHVLEHFPHGQLQAVLVDWIRALKPGGLLKIAVPDFPSIAQNYLAKREQPTQGYLMGGQVDQHDFHKAVFDFDTLSELMRFYGLVSINAWDSEIEDCARLPISLNLCGWKRPQRWPKVNAVMSVPRLGFMDNFFCAFDALVPLKIGIKKFTGAFWGQCMERAFEETLKDEAPEFILTIDYDTVFERRDIEDMLMLMVNAPSIDALAPIQAARSKTTPLFVIAGANGKGVSQIESTYFDVPAAKALTAHFGCTLVRTASLKDLPKPWFHSKPSADGSWNEGRVDDDIYFWHRFAAAGKNLRIASRVSVGHMELMVRWPNEQMQAIYQHHAEYNTDGKPEAVWK